MLWAEARLPPTARVLPRRFRFHRSGPVVRSLETIGSHASDLIALRFFTYSAFGLRICSEFECPELPAGSGPPDVRFRFGIVPSDGADSATGSQLSSASQGKYFLNVSHVARYLVQRGVEIIVEPAPSADADAVRLFLLGSALGALLHQRSALPVHGSAIVTPRGAVIFAGPSGCGKSTLAGAFFRKGFGILADDVAVIDSETVSVFPGAARLMLWADVLPELDIVGRNLQPVRRGLEKYSLPVQESLSGEPIRLHAMYILETSNSDRPTISRVTGLAKIEALTRNTFRNNLIEPVDIASFFTRAASVAGAFQMKRAVRPRHGFRIDDFVDLLIEDFAP